MVAKVETVESCTAYDAAPATEPQLMVRAIGWSIAAAAGEESDGVSGMAMVVKFQAPAHLHVPPTLVALTCQKYPVPGVRPPTAYFAVVNPVWFTTVEPKVDAVESSRV